MSKWSIFIKKILRHFQLFFFFSFVENCNRKVCFFKTEIVICEQCSESCMKPLYFWCLLRYMLWKYISQVQLAAPPIGQFWSYFYCINHIPKDLIVYLPNMKALRLWVLETRNGELTWKNANCHDLFSKYSSIYLMKCILRLNMAKKIVQ